MNLTGLKALFVRVGARKLFAKPLAENDNAKNQVYLGPDVEAFNRFPNLGIISDPKNSTFKAKLRFAWLTAQGDTAEAPGAQLILYPQYPEVRLSGFLRGCEAAPSALMAERISGRVLFLAVTGDRRVIAFVVGGGDEIAVEFRALGLPLTDGVFVELSLPTIPDEADSRARLLVELGRINRLGWIDSKQLDSHGKLGPCLAPQCGGFTLEAELGIPKNSASEPDFLGWEVKQHSVTNFARAESGRAITLMTPEPTSGFYTEYGVDAFVRKFGYIDRNGKVDRLNFGGIHRVGERHHITGLTMRLRGYDSAQCKIVDASGAIELVSDMGEVAAAWSLSAMLAHWSRKHTQSAYVPSMMRESPSRQYSYGPEVRLARGTDGLRLLKALASGAVYYDPGIKLEQVSSEKPTSKRRSQFRVASKNIAALYEAVEKISV